MKENTAMNDLLRQALADHAAACEALMHLLDHLMNDSADYPEAS